ncbi:heterokaryon incompatibility protein-domain-containing protein [Cercophora newfieldiana]|uniref:Heterokaryon incompatibility protein-domain-containing protein n=1 Tax=Cercophora newfieldiana TaxID=92897 RepID=A0AA40CMH3_9PEZI|nr:heterokaryon incompatibility protein-domain-containing protein [Cercophora newfieldiana]
MVSVCWVRDGKQRRKRPSAIAFSTSALIAPDNDFPPPHPSTIKTPTLGDVSRRRRPINGAMSALAYTPLDPTKHEIRLLHLKSRNVQLTSSRAPLECTLVPASLDLYLFLPSSTPWTALKSRFHPSNSAGPPQHYHALSYVWGDPTPAATITINETPVQIGQSLHDALLAIREQTPHRVIWVDALCINQTDPHEQSQQVQQMDVVYFCAAGVIAWLGPSSPATAAAFKALEEVLKLTGRIGTFRGARKHNSGAKTNRSPGSCKLQLLEGVQNIFRGRGMEGVYDAVVELSKREYWERVWIIQEMALARDIEFLCGTVKAKGVHHALLGVNMASEMALMIQDDSIVPLGDAVTYRLTYAMGRGLPSFFADNERVEQLKKRGLYHLLFYVRGGMGYKATNPRDYVYGLLGLAVDRQALRIVPDYTQPVEEVFAHVMRRLLANGFTDALSFAVSSKTILGLPSWVPDWSSMSHVFFCTFRTAQAQPQPETPDIILSPHPSDNSTALSILGSPVGTITHLAPALDWDPTRPEELGSAIISWLARVERELLLSPEEEEAQFWNNPDPVVIGTPRRDQDRARLARSLCAMRDPISNVWERHEPERYYKLLAASVSNLQAYIILQHDGLEGGMAKAYLASIVRHARLGARAYRLSTGHLGLVSPGCEVGDKVVHFPGGSFPFVLRKEGEDGIAVGSLGDGGVEGDQPCRLVGITFVDDFRFWLMKGVPTQRFTLC